MNRPTGSRRQLSTVTVPLEPVRDLAHSSQSTVNDVLVTAIVGACSALLRRRDEIPEALVVSVPISGRRATTADRLGKCWGLGSGTKKDPGPWEGELRNMWKPTQVPNLWMQGGNLHQNRHYSLCLALQLKARMEGLPTPVYGLAPVHHTS